MQEPGEERPQEPSADPLTLGIDTATGPSSVAVVAGDRLAGETGPTGRETDRWIVDAIRRSLDAVGVGRHELDLVAVTCGPGAFTGIRVGLSTALGIAAAAAVPVTGVGTLEALAEAAGARGGRVLACHDARRRQVYAAIFELGDDASLPLEPVWGPEAISPEELVERVSGLEPRPVAVGSGPERYPEVAAAAAGTASVEGGLAAAAARLAARTLRLHGTDSLPPVRPNYLREADVRIRPSPLARRRPGDGHPAD